jgi:GntR family transcriptional regulator
VIDRSSPIPLYHQLSELLLNQIVEGQLRPGEAVPTEQELIESHKVSRITVRSAMAELERSGFVRREQGRGTFVAPPRIQRGIARLTSFSEEIVARGMHPDTRLLTLRRQPATGSEARTLSVEEGHTIWYVERLRLADSEPIALSTSHLNLPPPLGLTESELESESSLWAILKGKGMTFAEADRTIEAIPADDFQARLLQVSVDAPLLLVEAIVYATDGTPVEFSQVVARTDRYKYYLHVRR